MKAARTGIFEPEVNSLMYSGLFPGPIHDQSGSLRSGTVYIAIIVMHSIMSSFFILSVVFAKEDSMGKNAQTCGLSWVKPGTHEPFSKSESDA